MKNLGRNVHRWSNMLKFNLNCIKLCGWLPSSPSRWCHSGSIHLVHYLSRIYLCGILLEQHPANLVNRLWNNSTSVLLVGQHRLHVRILCLFVYTFATDARIWPLCVLKRKSAEKMKFYSNEDNGILYTVPLSHMQTINCTSPLSALINPQSAACISKGEEGQGQDHCEGFWHAIALTGKTLYILVWSGLDLFKVCLSIKVIHVLSCSLHWLYFLTHI